MTVTKAEYNASSTGLILTWHVMEAEEEGGKQASCLVAKQVVEVLASLHYSTTPW